MADLAIDPRMELNPPLVQGGMTYATSTRRSAPSPETKPPKQWYYAIAITSLMTLMLFGVLTYLVATGIGVWGNNNPVGWGWDITNFVWWIGIGHAGTLISAILFLFRQKWRTSINRAAEAMTLFAVACAGIYPAVPHRPPVARDLLAVPGPELVPAPLAELPQPADVGRVRGLDLRHGLGAVLVHGPGSRSRDAARSRDEPSPQDGLRHC